MVKKDVKVNGDPTRKTRPCVTEQTVTDGILVEPGNGWLPISVEPEVLSRNVEVQRGDGKYLLGMERENKVGLVTNSCYGEKWYMW